MLLKNATKVRKDGSTGKLLPIAVPPTGTFKVLVTGFYAQQHELLPRRLLEHAGHERRRPRRSRRYNGIKAAIQAVNPTPQVDFMRGFTGTGTNAGNCCSTVDAAAVTAAAGYDYVIVYAGMDSTARPGRPAPRTATAPRSCCRASRTR